MFVRFFKFYPFRSCGYTKNRRSAEADRKKRCSIVYLVVILIVELNIMLFQNFFNKPLI